MFYHYSLWELWEITLQIDCNLFVSEIDVQEALMSSAENNYSAAGLLDETPQRVPGHKVIQELLKLR